MYGNVPWVRILPCPPIIAISNRMKIAITGHTSGLGRAFYNHFSLNHEVIGLSRSNGYDIVTSNDRIIKAVQGFDLFFNNAHAGHCQGSLIKNLYDKIPIITSGSMAADYVQTNNPYFRDKKVIENIHKFFVKKGCHPMLLLKMGFLENYTDRPHIRYSEVISAVEFWISNPKLTLIEFDNLT